MIILKFLRSKNLLFGRIRELILSPSIVALNNTTILPKVFDCFNVWGFERSNRFVVNCTYQLRFILKFYHRVVRNRNNETSR